MTKVSARCVANNAHASLKEVRVQCSRAFFGLCSENRYCFLGHIVIEDETWVHHYQLEYKQNYRQWHYKSTSTPMKLR